MASPPAPTIGSLFSGYGGLDLAVEHVLGGTTVWHSDTDRASSRVLAHRFPDLPNLGDIAAINWDTVPRVDVLAGGFPCQDLSTAGKRAGIAPGTRSGLWAHMAYAIDKLRPRLVVFENVRGLLSAPSTAPSEPDLGAATDRAVDRPDLDHRTGPGIRALGTVLGDLAERGYDCRWLGLPASTIGTAHQRFRVFGIAWPRGTDPGRVQPERRRADRATGSAATPVDFPGGVDPRGTRPNGSPPASRSRSRIDWGKYTGRIQHWENVTARPSPYPLVEVNGRDRLAPEWVEWLMGLPPGWVTEVPGITRPMAMRLLGNGVVPGQAVAALTSLLEPLPAILDQPDK